MKISSAVTTTRREAIASIAACAAFPALTAGAVERRSEHKMDRKIKVGVVGNGGRGAWIAGLFAKHGGYEMHAVADYFQEKADRCGDAIGVDKSRRFSTLSGYKQLIESGIEAIAIETPPYFMPEIAAAAVQAGLHVYLAKPVATDVPGCQSILASSHKSSAAKKCFLVDYQIPTDPVNQGIVKKIHDGAIGKVVQVNSWGGGSPGADPPFTGSYESRLTGLIWVADYAMGGDVIGNFDIHAIDTALWVLGARPIAAMGASSISRPDPHGDAREVCSVVYDYASGAVHNHLGQSNLPTSLCCHVWAQNGKATIMYWGSSELHGPDLAINSPVENLYEAGATRNIAKFYTNITEDRYENETTQRAVDGALTCYLGREAGIRRRRITMAEFIKEGKHATIDLKGLKR